jgi:MFS transporter, DHA1 family, multidrug resistance protein
VLCALSPLSIDMGLPGLPFIQQAFDVNADATGLTLSLFMAGFATTPIVYGILSDRHGRRPLLLAGLALFALGGVVCAMAPSIGWLLGARFVQGAGAGAGPTIAFAATRDQFTRAPSPDGKPWADLRSHASPKTSG